MAVNLTRRWFLGGALAVVGATVLPSLPNGYPLILGNGIHDDTLGLQAALDGKTFMVDDQVMTGASEIVLKRGKYRLTDTLRITNSVSLIGERGEGNGWAELFGDHDGVILNVEFASNITLCYLCFRSRGPSVDWVAPHAIEVNLAP